MANSWNIEVVRVNFGIGGNIEKQISDKLKPVLKGIDGEIKDIIYTNPADIQKAIIFIVYRGSYTPQEEKKSIEKGGIKAEIINK